MDYKIVFFLASNFGAYVSENSGVQAFKAHTGISEKGNRNNKDPGTCFFYLCINLTIF